MRKSEKSIYMEEWSEIPAKEKTDRLIGLVIKNYRYESKAILSNVNDSLMKLLNGMHECDVLLVTKNNYGVEFEIKVSISDLRKDLKKYHSHEHELIKKTFFVVPTDLIDEAKKILPPHFGIIEYVIGSKARLYEHRSAKIKKAIKWSDLQVLEIYKKAYYRYLTIKEEIV